MPVRRPVPCIRCQADLPDGAAYCAACGAPQLRVTEDEIAAAAAMLAGANLPRQQDLAAIQWPAAVSVALVAGLGAGVLSSMLVGGLQFFMLIWIIGGAAAGVTLYSRRFPRASIGSSVGARIGILTGFFCASVSTLLSSLTLVAQRFLFGQGHQIDSTMDELVHQLAVVSAQMTPPGQQNPYMVQVQGPEGHAILMVTAMISSFFFTLLVMSISGAVSGHYFAMRRKVQGRTT